jgi:hypothetical protein
VFEGAFFAFSVFEGAFFALQAFAVERFTFGLCGYMPLAPWPVWPDAVRVPSVRRRSRGRSRARQRSVRDSPRAARATASGLPQEAAFPQPFPVVSSARAPTLPAEHFAFRQAACEAFARPGAIRAPIGGVERAGHREGFGLTRLRLGGPQRATEREAGDTEREHEQRTDAEHERHRRVARGVHGRPAARTAVA